METKLKQLRGPDSVLLSINAAINTLDLARNTTGVESVKDAFGSAGLLLTTIRVRFPSSGPCWAVADRCTQDSVIEEKDCVELGLTCSEVCQALDRGINGRRQEQLSQPVIEAIERLKA